MTETIPDAQAEKVMDMFLESAASEEKLQTKAHNILDLPKDEAAKVLCLIFKMHAEEVDALKARLESVVDHMADGYQELKRHMENAASEVDIMKNRFDDFEEEMDTALYYGA